MNKSRLIALIVLLALPTSLSAADGVQIPEASSSVLFALGVLGVLIGRHASRKRNSKHKD